MRGHRRCRAPRRVRRLRGNHIQRPVPRHLHTMHARHGLIATSTRTVRRQRCHRPVRTKTHYLTGICRCVWARPVLPGTGHHRNTTSRRPARHTALGSPLTVRSAHHNGRHRNGTGHHQVITRRHRHRSRIHRPGIRENSVHIRHTRGIRATRAIRLRAIRIIRGIRGIRWDERVVLGRGARDVPCLRPGPCPRQRGLLRTEPATIVAVAFTSAGVVEVRAWAFRVQLAPHHQPRQIAHTAEHRLEHTRRHRERVPRHLLTRGGLIPHLAEQLTQAFGQRLPHAMPEPRRPHAPHRHPRVMIQTLAHHVGEAGHRRHRIQLRVLVHRFPRRRFQNLLVHLIAESPHQHLRQRVAHQTTHRRQRQRHQRRKRPHPRRLLTELPIPPRTGLLTQHLHLGLQIRHHVERHPTSRRHRQPHEQLTPPPRQQQPHHRTPRRQPRHRRTTGRPRPRHRPRHLHRQQLQPINRDQLQIPHLPRQIPHEHRQLPQRPLPRRQQTIKTLQPSREPVRRLPRKLRPHLPHQLTHQSPTSPTPTAPDSNASATANNTPSSASVISSPVNT